MAKARRRRGSLTVWFDPEMIWQAAPTGKRGRQPDYRCEEDQETVGGTFLPTNAIRTCLTLKGDGRRGNDPVDRFSPERAEPRPGLAWRPGRSSHGNATGPSDHDEAGSWRAFRA